MNRFTVTTCRRCPAFGETMHEFKPNGPYCKVLSSHQNTYTVSDLTETDMSMDGIPDRCPMIQRGK